ncbi:MAG TPA: four helix bundle protein [Verrucomicrobiae bacterium]|nr:four helix bundle protein [Verrucomicrobiae bacterium]
MATVRRFEELEVWQAARDLARQTYKIANQPSFRRDFGLRDQITRAATSTMSNIAEGFERGTRKEFIQFLHVAKASNGEVRSQLYVALDQEYLDQTSFSGLEKETLLLSRRLATFIAYLERFPNNRRSKRSEASLTCNL